MKFLGPILIIVLLGGLVLSRAAEAQDMLPGWSEDANSPLHRHWNRPISPQGKSHEDLSPRSCGTCHMDKFEAWSTSRHARAMSEGVLGQIMAYRSVDRSLCMDCHAPLAEQFNDFEKALGQGSAPEGMDLAESGNGCAGCHMRGGKIFGPTGGLGTDAPHGRTSKAPWFEDPLFCTACHQFPQKWAVNGKPLLNTYEEWKASPQAREGQTCQTCHMPGRRHLWRGIHDPKTVESGLTAKVTKDGKGARFTLTNTGVGHAFPSYTTPKVMIYAVGLDGRGRPVPETLVSRTIHRSVRQSGGQWEELSDTRLMPGQSAELFLAWGRGFDQVRFWLQVDPDYYYTNHFYDEVRLTLPSGGKADELLATAQAKGTANRYKLFETVVGR